MAANAVLIIDTSILCVWLKIPNMETCGTNENLWNYEKAEKEIQKHIKEKFTLVLPLATIIETGNHIAHANHSRRERAKALADIITKTANEETPWAAFVDQSGLWTPENLKKLAKEWPNLAAPKMTIGDATIKQVADYYGRMGFKVTLLTCDAQLKAYEPARPDTPIPRRRQ